MLQYKLPSIYRSMGVAALVCAGVFASLSLSLTASAADFPKRPIRLVVAFPAGGGVDTAARVVSNELGRQLGQTVVVDNISGAAGNIGVERVVRSPNDGYTLLFASIALSINPSLYQNLTFDPIKDLTPVSLVSSSPFVLLVNKDSPIKDVKELIATARANPKALQYASAGNGSGAHLFTELFIEATGAKMDHIPYRGSAQAMTDLVGGQVPVAFDTIMTALPLIESGKVRALGLTTKQRSVIAPNILPLNDVGVPGYDATSWFGIFAPAGTPPDVVKQLNMAINATLESKEVSERLKALGATPMGSTPAEEDKFFRNEVDKWRTVVQQAHVVVN